MMQRVLQLQEAMTFSQQQVSQSLASSQARIACSRTQEGLSAAAGEQPRSSVQSPSASQQQNAGQPVPTFQAGLSLGLRAQTCLSVHGEPQALHTGRAPAARKPAWQAEDAGFGLMARSQAAHANSSCRRARTAVADSESDEDPEELLQQVYMAEVLNMPALHTGK